MEDVGWAELDIKEGVKLYQTEVTLGQIPHVFNTLRGILPCRRPRYFRPSHNHARSRRRLSIANSLYKALEDSTIQIPGHLSSTTTGTETLGNEEQAEGISAEGELLSADFDDEKLNNNGTKR
jgi:hypothetical protein